MAEVWFVYIVRCGDGSLYAGIAKDVEQRVVAHEAGTGARYTRGRGPIQLVASAGPFTKGDALRLEYRVKKAPAAKKIAVLDACIP
ncbi:MAG: GIY-YIG nuclease family protein [Myxococcota bacterium]